MGSLYIPPFGTKNIVLSTTQKVAVFSRGVAQVFHQVGGIAKPNSYKLIGSTSNGIPASFGPFTDGGGTYITADGQSALYEIGTAPTVTDVVGRKENFLSTISFIGNATATANQLLNNALLVNQAGGAINITLPTAADIIAATNLEIEDSFRFYVQGGSAGTTLVSNTNVTMTYNATVPANTAATFLAQRIDDDQVWVYRIAG